MKSELFPFNFHGDKLYIVEHKGEPYVAMKHVVEGMGLAWAAQRRRIVERFPGGVIKMITPINDTPQEMIFMSVRKLPGWLMTINSKKLRPEIRDKVLRYQQECDDALYDYWTKGLAINPRLKLRDRLYAFDRMHATASLIRAQRYPSQRKMLYVQLQELADLLGLDAPELEDIPSHAPRNGDAALDGEAMYEFWDLYEMLEGALIPQINHSADKNMIAIDPFEFRAKCEDRRLTFPDINALRNELHTRSRYRFIRYETITSAVTHKPVRCWLFDCSRGDC